MKKASILISMVLCALVTVAVISQFCVQPVAAGKFHYKITLWQVGCDAHSVGYVTHDGNPITYDGGQYIRAWSLNCKDGKSPDFIFQTDVEVNDWHFTIWIYESCHLGDPAYLLHTETVDEGPFTVPHSWKKVLSPTEVTMNITTASVGGVWVPVDKFGLLAPYIGLTSTILVATATTAIYVKRVKHREEKQ